MMHWWVARKEHLFYKLKEGNQYMGWNKHQEPGTKKIDKIFKSLGLTHSQFDDNFMHFKIDLDGNMLIILLYVDDLSLVGDHIKMM
jgi:hypothetical protein